MRDRIDSESMDFSLAVLHAGVQDLIDKFNEGSGWSVVDVNYSTVEVNEFGRKYPYYVCSYFNIKVR